MRRAENELAHSKDKCNGGYCKYLFGKIEAEHKMRLDELAADRLQSAIASPRQAD